MRPGRALAAGVLMALVTACGNTDSPEVVLEETEDQLAEIRSGQLSLLLTASSAGQGRAQVGFGLEGRFAIAQQPGDLPVADLTYTRFTGEEERSNRFVITGSEAFVERDGEMVRLPEDAVSELRAGGGDERAAQGLEGLHLRAWMDEPSIASGPPSGGRPTYRITTSQVDPVAVLNDLMTLAADFEESEGDLPGRLEGDGAERLRRLMKRGEAEIVTGREDRLLREATVFLEMDSKAPEQLREALGSLAGFRLDLKIAVTDVNKPVSVDAP